MANKYRGQCLLGQLEAVYATLRGHHLVFTRTLERAIIPAFQRRKLRHEEVVACPESHSLGGQSVTQSCSLRHQLRCLFRFPWRRHMSHIFSRGHVRSKPLCGGGKRRQRPERTEITVGCECQVGSHCATNPQPTTREWGHLTATLLQQQTTGSHLHAITRQLDTFQNTPSMQC